MKPSALISVCDKSHITPFAKALTTEFAFDIISTGGTAKHLRSQTIPVTEVSDITDFQEILGGRVKTLHPLIHGGILAQRGKKADDNTMHEHALPDIRIVCVNLYPFSDVVAKGGSLEEVIENIDIGGVALIRAAAKNHEHVAITTTPEQYERVVQDLRTSSNGMISAALRRQLAYQAFATTAAYDSAITQYFSNNTAYISQAENNLPPHLSFNMYQSTPLRYGENPHQKAALYTVTPHSHSLPYKARLHQGKELSYNNLHDMRAAIQLVNCYDKDLYAAVGIVKHANPCGCALSKKSLEEAYIKAYQADSISAFGGIIALNRPLDAQTAKHIIGIFTEVIVAPDISPQALDIMSQKKNLRVVTIENMHEALPNMLEIYMMDKETLLVQEQDPCIASSHISLQKVSGEDIAQQHYDTLLFAWQVVKHVKSNAIVVASNGQTLGIGAGQMNRIDSLKIALDKASEKDFANPADWVVASDAFFPFTDAIELMQQYGVKAVIQPGGAMRDTQVIKAAQKSNISMYFTGQRHFKH